MKSEEYWRKRFEILKEKQFENAEKYLDVLTEEYKKAYLHIEEKIAKWYTRLAVNNEVSLAEAKKLLNNEELKEFKWTVEEYIEKGKKNGLDEEITKQLENASARVHISRLQAMKLQIQAELEQLYAKQNIDITELQKNIYSNTYYQGAYEIQKGMNMAWEISALPKELINKVISKPWTTDGLTFSNRIWNNQNELINTLQTELVQALIRGENPYTLVDIISKKFNVSRGKAGRLVMTESAFFSSAGQKKCFDELNVERYKIIATLDSHTSEICQEMDGKIFKRTEYEPGVTADPFHINCRTTTAPYFDDEYTERIARDPETGKTYYVDGNITYKEWKEKYVKDTSTKENNDDKIIKTRNNKVKDVNYEDITEKTLIKGKQNYKLIEQQYFIDENKKRYNVDGKYVVLSPTKREIEVANILGSLYGGEVKIIPRISYPLGIKTPDFIINGEKFDLKEITGNGKYVIEGNIRKKKEQSNNFIIDVTKSNLTNKEIQKQINGIYISKRFKWIDKLLIINESDFIKIYKRKKIKSTANQK